MTICFFTMEISSNRPYLKISLQEKLRHYSFQLLVQDQQIFNAFKHGTLKEVHIASIVRPRTVIITCY